MIVGGLIVGGVLAVAGIVIRKLNKDDGTPRAFS